ncbi:NAD(P)/FAD-dependent oxidoreductase [uncultured Methanomethylovorans sp.]|uniref:NAD(P)/FAD-dependent oxidoreductase n=1 Tax=uncultured Methanomethylovorans sp. TaxID=183759 RepID=UPI002AA658C2|nr:NAD(P)/FAD-dependent oxidoreductase [uncultured Methanomethylovorans sp.]
MTSSFNRPDYDVIIVGAGPAGMFAARELACHKLKILIIDMGSDVNDRHCSLEPELKCTHCLPCDIMCGVGGAGTYSDGTLNLRPDIGGDLSAFTEDENEAWNLVEEVDEIFLEYGATTKTSMPDQQEIEMLQRRAASVGAKFIEIRQRHIGSDDAKEVISRFKHDLDIKGVHFMLRTRVINLIIKNCTCYGVILEDGTYVTSKNVLLCPGRIGCEWVSQLVAEHSIEAGFSGVDIGIRVEVPAIIMDPVTRINHDPKFHISTSRYDDFVRTFCTNEHGFVVKENYQGFIATNGHSMHTMTSDNTNFAFLVHVELTHPMENTIKYAKSVAKLATTIGGGKPVLQRMGDLRRGRRSTEARIAKNNVRNTLKDITPGDISMALPHRIVMDIIEGLDTLNMIIPGVNSDSTLLYAPEVKLYAMEVSVDKNMQTSVKGLFAAGDGTGLSRDLVNSAATGLLAARGIVKLNSA